MRYTVGLLLLLAATAPAQGKKDYKFTDAFWGVEYTAPGLRKTLALGDPAILFKGKCKGRIVVTIRVHEAEKPAAAKDWIAKRIASWERKKRALTDLVKGEHFLHYKHKTLAGFEEHHGHAFFVRDHHCFELQAVADATDAAAALARAWGGLKLAEKAPGTMHVYRMAREKGRPLDDPEILLLAGREYVAGRLPIPTLGARVFAHARALMKPDTYKPVQLWMLYEFGGMALHDKPAAAIEWHSLAEQAARKLTEGAGDRGRRSAYNLACVCSLAGKLDDAFAALDRAFTGGKPVSDGHVSGDKDLEPLRKDERWHTFWREKVKK